MLNLADIYKRREIAPSLKKTSIINKGNELQLREFNPDSLLVDGGFDFKLLALCKMFGIKNPEINFYLYRLTLNGTRVAFTVLITGLVASLIFQKDPQFFIPSLCILFLVNSALLFSYIHLNIFMEKVIALKKHLVVEDMVFFGTNRADFLDIMEHMEKELNCKIEDDARFLKSLNLPDFRHITKSIEMKATSCLTWASFSLVAMLIKGTLWSIERDHLFFSFAFLVGLVSCFFVFLLAIASSLQAQQVENNQKSLTEKVVNSWTKTNKYL